MKVRTGWFALFVAVLGGCAAPPRGGTLAPSMSGLSAPDVRTEATLIEMENQYIADKNDQPTHQHEVEAKKKKQEEEKKEKEAAALKRAEVKKQADAQTQAAAGK